MSTPSPSRPIEVLIVEDDPMMQLGLEQALSSQTDLKVVGLVDDGFLAVKTAIELKPDLIVMDIGLPRQDGIAATQQIKEALPNVRVVMLTSYTAETEVVAALSSGADAYCVKGANIDRLLTAIYTAREGGAYLDPQVANRVMQHLKPPMPHQNFGELSPRELEVLKLVVEGYSNVEIGEALFLSPNTVKTHVRGIMNKLAVNDRVQAAVTALRSGLV
ncbi:MAG TPA: response regulator transcription factor [Oscillatoriales cyanobacterium M59_W2019_021]|nr:MAG: DNA-binding response regulator [Cyanobacteria bacterium J055]HIK31903.1 response regulator transcription factor [Oscillatoriales cyanobacterium M4454_W2019_049]HIK52496.1 response regulator transcription factor [Oscillatoriales cyanobacterium M59_W2019_021]